MVSPKHHTIRAGSRWKVGDKFSPRVWSGKPYNSKQIVIAPDIEIVKVWDVELGIFPHLWHSINGKLQDVSIEQLAQNDGLQYMELVDWFFGTGKETFTGQIICWNESVNY